MKIPLQLPNYISWGIVFSLFNLKYVKLNFCFEWKILTTLLWKRAVKLLAWSRFQTDDPDNTANHPQSCNLSNFTISLAGLLVRITSSLLPMKSGMVRFVNDSHKMKLKTIKCKMSFERVENWIETLNMANASMIIYTFRASLLHTTIFKQNHSLQIFHNRIQSSRQIYQRDHSHTPPPLPPRFLRVILNSPLEKQQMRV